MLPPVDRPPWLSVVAVFALVAGASLAIPPAALEAQVRDPIEPAGMDFRRDGAWRRRTREIRDQRSDMLRRGDVAGLNRASGMVLRGPFAVQAIGAPGPAVTGRYVLPVIPLGYLDVPVPYTAADFQSVLFGATPPVGRPYTLKTFYEELSRGRIEMEGVVFPAFAHNQNAAWVTDGCNGLTIPGRTSCTRTGSQNRMGQMLVAALQSLSGGLGQDTVWNAFDNDGPDGLPNSGDDDGYVDFVTFLHPEVGGECSGNSGIWAHRWRMSVWNNGSPFVTGTPRRNAQGQPIPGQFLVIEDYTIQSQRGGSTGCSGGAIMPVGTVAHETGHAFGLPDLYDTSNQTYGIGDWSLMSFGNQVTQNSPSSYDAWSLVTLGWATVDELTTNRVVTTGPRVLSDTVFLATTPATPQQYLLIENRQPVGSDTAQMGPGAPIGRRKAPGLLFWYVDEQKIVINTNSNTVNAGTTHGVALLQADGLNQLRTRSNRGDMGDAYPGTSNNTRFGLTTNPVARTYQGIGLGFGIDSITQLPGEAMTFRFTRGGPTVVTASHPDVLVRVNLVPYQRYEEIVAPGSLLAVAVDQQLELLGGHSRATFLSWSDGGTREHSLAASATADTLIANMALEHRLLAMTDGLGTVTSDRPGNLLAGIFLPQGLPATLTATPAPGGAAYFTGWTGDTVSGSRTLVLPMGRPYDVTALFTTSAIVPLEEATAGILGTTTLSAEQRQQLDALGNQNGYFDVGDYLALLQRVGAIGGAPPAPGGQP